MASEKKTVKVTIDTETGAIETKFTGTWIGRDVYAALRALEKGYRRHVAERRVSEAR